MIRRVLKPGDLLIVGETVIRMEHKSGKCCVLVIDAPSGMQVHTSQQLKQKTTAAENKEAV